MTGTVPTPGNLIAWADKIDRRLGPISGRDADALAVLLRAAAKAIDIYDRVGRIEATLDATRAAAAAPR